MSLLQKRALVSPKYTALSVKQQCILIGLARSSYYFKPRGESGYNLHLMDIIDRKFTELPFYGVERMTDHLRLDLGHRIDVKRVRRLYHIMALNTLHPKPNLSKANKADYKYPYLLRNLSVSRPNQVWEADITYLPMYRGFMYKFAIIDVYSRMIIGWSISNTMSVEWCLEVVASAVKEHGAPQILNTDQGSQFTSPKYIEFVKSKNIQISMDGKGRALDNIFIERYWRSYKYEYLYLNPPNGGAELYNGTKKYVEFYNNERRHDSIGKLTPNEFYFKHKQAS